MKVLLALGLVLLSCHVSEARTWYVEKDGSGDFVSPQDAALAASEGDTIRIGPGRFEEFVVDSPGGDITGIMAPHVDNIVIVGAGTDRTFFGPAEFLGVEEHEWMAGIISYLPWNSSSVVVEGIRFENLLYGVLAQDGQSVAIRNCFFWGCSVGAVLGKETVIVDDCEGIGKWRWSFFFMATFASSDVRTFTMKRCRFNGFEGSPSPVGVTMIASDEFLMDECEFSGTFTSLALSGYGEGTYTISRCVFSGGSYNGLGYGIKINNFYLGSPVFRVQDCQFSDFDVAIYEGTSGRCRLECDRVVVQGVLRSSIEYYYTVAGHVHDSVLAQGASGVICPKIGSKSEPGSLPPVPDLAWPEKTESPTVFPDLDPLYFDMTNNWWGTSEPDSIQAWITDGVDDPERPLIVLWDPFKEELVPVEKNPLGGIRSMFR